MGIRTPVFAVRGRRLRPLDHGGTAAELGFEPRMNESESLVLPLHHSASFSFSRSGLSAERPDEIHYSTNRRICQYPFSSFFEIFLKPFAAGCRAVPISQLHAFADLSWRTPITVCAAHAFDMRI